MAGNHNSGRKPKYLTIEAFEQFRNNDFFHLKVEVRTASIILGLCFATIIAIALKIFLG